MGLDGFRAGDDGRAAEALVEQAALILRGTRGDVPERFAAALFARASAEDLAGHEAHALADLAADAFDHLATRRPGTADVRVGAPRPGGVSVVEIVNDDMPFLVDSVAAELAEQGLDVRLVAHPVFTVERDGAGGLLAWLGDSTADGGRRLRESLIHLHVPRIDDEAKRAAVVQALETTLADVRAAVADWRPMREAVQRAIAGIEAAPGPVPPETVAEAAAFLRWMADDNFVFLGVRDYAMTSAGELEPQFDTGLGLLRPPSVRVLKRGAELVTMTPEIRGFLAAPEPIIVTKANVRSRVHRRVHMDYVGVKRIDATGRLLGELRFIGLFASTAYSGSARAIPLLRRKVDAVLQRAGFDRAGHSGKALVHVLEGYPRDDLLEIDDDLLYRHALAIVDLGERPRIRVLTRHDRFDRFVSALVFVPRDRYDSAARARIGELLAETFHGRVVTAQPTFGQGTLVRVRFVIGRYEGATPTPDLRRLEDAVARLVRTWADGLADALAVVHAPDRAAQLAARWREAFDPGYRDAFPSDQAVADIRVLENLSADKPIAIDYYRRAGETGAGRLGLKVWSRGRALPLSERVPMLENMGFVVVNERTYRLMPAGGEAVWLHDMTLECRTGPVDLAALDRRLEATLMGVLKGEIDNDGFNALTLLAGLPWRDVALVRSLAHVLRQIGLPFSLDYVWGTLARHPDIAARIAALFHVRFDPRRDLSVEARAAAQAAMVAAFEAALAAVDSLDEDRILRHLVNLVQAAVRTNFFQIAPDGGPRPAIAIKFDSRRIDGLPAPRPLYEIFVASPRVEGVHLRFGKVARGGLRWSDRPQDLRTEVLGLVKAQQVKNAVIVPVGAKGGFVPRRLPPASDRAAWLAEGTEAYRLFVRSLLDVTDTIDGDAIVPPAHTVRHDGDDPYLVVAADKGTATFSDTANALAQERGFWLGDAFASGGSAGYDHKGMGITARGTFEAVKRHFREMDVDVTATAVTVAGVGDMSGDVFGNGLLQAKTFRLLAAFDHRDIFLDPDPDPAASWAERKRLFDLPRSSWRDYDPTLISPGGGVFARGAKAIALSPQAAALLGIGKAEATPAEVMNAILKLPVDLLWFGGIGTYVRAAGEGNDQVGDRANDAIRVTGRELRCKVVGEGANLGMTQRGRIEAARAGVRLNTDAIDNSAGVNTSDVEVNIKVALGPVVRSGGLDVAARDALLAQMTDAVAAAVLRNNYLQTLAISLAERRGPSELGFLQRTMQALEAAGRLDRALEALPDDAELAERRKQGAGLTRPELAVMLAYAKLWLNDELLASPVPDDPYLAMELRRYFPPAMRDGWPDAVAQHRLRREIIATGLANSMINRGGPAFLVRIVDQTGAAAPAIARAFAVVRDAYGMTALNTAIDALDARVRGSTQLALYAAVQDLLLSRVVWTLRNVALDAGLDPIVARYRAGVEALAAALDGLLSAAAADDRERRIAALAEERVPADLARRIADLPALALAPDAVLVADRTGIDVPAAAATLLALAARFDTRRLQAAAGGMTPTDRFDRLAIDRALDAVDLALRRLAVEVVGAHGAGAAGVTAWSTARGAEVDRIARALGEIAGSAPSLAKLTLAASLLGDLLRG